MLPVHCYCCLLRLKLWLRLKLRPWLRLWLRLKLWLMLHSAQKQGKPCLYLFLLQLLELHLPLQLFPLASCLFLLPLASSSCLFLLPLPLLPPSSCMFPLPLPLLLLPLALASSYCSFLSCSHSAASHGPYAEQPAFQLGTEASRTRPGGSH